MVSDADVATMTEACQIQNTLHCAPAWNMSPATIKFYPKGSEFQIGVGSFLLLMMIVAFQMHLGGIPLIPVMTVLLDILLRSQYYPMAV